VNMRSPEVDEEIAANPTRDDYPKRQTDSTINRTTRIISSIELQ
jgi:hypothetical protein